MEEKSKVKTRMQTSHKRRMKQAERNTGANSSSETMDRTSCFHVSSHSVPFQPASPPPHPPCWCCHRPVNSTAEVNFMWTRVHVSQVFPAVGLQICRETCRLVFRPWMTSRRQNMSELQSAQIPASWVDRVCGPTGPLETEVLFVSSGIKPAQIFNIVLKVRTTRRQLEVSFCTI